jgi:Cu(I)/Ag(I) efflux system membrane fusion protein
VLAGFGLAQLTFHPAKAPEAPAAPTDQTGRKVLYWYDPMKPEQHFDKPGKSPFMDMQLLPKYANEGGGPASGVQVDPRTAQSLGVRTAVARTGDLDSSLVATGAIEFNQRDVAIIQPRANGFVQRVYARAPGDVIDAGAPIVDLLIPDWGGAQAEFLALVRSGDPTLITAGRRRLELMGMPPSLISRIEKSGRPANVVTISSPISGVIQKLDVRPGMSVTAGQSLAEVNGLGTVWLNAAVPEAQADKVHVGQAVNAELSAYPGEAFAGRVTAIVPQAQAESHTVQARIELENRQSKLHPGLYATVRFGSTAKPALLVPTEAVIRTGRRDLVMLALDGGRYQPAEVRLGREANGQTEILAGLSEGERVVASGQFLLDSEASLGGLKARPIDAAPAGAGEGR